MFRTMDTCTQATIAVSPITPASRLRLTPPNTELLKLNLPSAFWWCSRDFSTLGCTCTLPLSLCGGRITLWTLLTFSVSDRPNWPCLHSKRPLLTDFFSYTPDLRINYTFRWLSRWTGTVQLHLLDTYVGEKEKHRRELNHVLKKKNSQGRSVLLSPLIVIQSSHKQHMWVQ